MEEEKIYYKVILYFKNQTREVLTNSAEEAKEILNFANHVQKRGIGIAGTDWLSIGLNRKEYPILFKNHNVSFPFEQDNAVIFRIFGNALYSTCTLYISGRIEKVNFNI